MRTRWMVFAVLLGSLMGQANARDAADGDVLVFGGTGRLGSDVVKSLLDAGRSVTVFARPTSDKKRLAGLDVGVVVGDVLDSDDVDNAFRAARFSAVVDALGRGSSDITFYRHSAVNIATSAAKAEVGQILLHGSVGAGNSWDIYPSERRGAMSDLMVEKTAGEQAVIESGVPYTIIRNARLYQYGTPATGKAKLFEGEDQIGSVTRADLGSLTAQCIGNEDCYNKIYHAIDRSLDW